MEKSGEAVDDQGSGWFEVKKKHRNSSKFSLQSWVGGFSGKNASNPLCSQSSLNGNSGNSHDKRRCHHPKGGGSYAVPSQSAVNSVDVLNEDKQNVRHFDNSVSKQIIECPKSSSQNVANSSSEVKSSEKMPQKDKPDVVHNINRGRVENNGKLHHENAFGAGIKFGAIEDNNLMVCRELENDHNFVYCTISQENKLVAPNDAVAAHMHPVTPKDQQLENNCSKLNEVSAKNVVVLNINENTADPEAGVSNCNDVSVKHVVNEDYLNATSTSGLEAETVVKVQDPVVTTPEVGDVEIQDTSKIDGNLSRAVLIEDNPELISPDNNGLKNSEEQPTSTTCIKDPGDLHFSTAQEHISNSHNINTLGECDTVESKERFRQRLWCFLFETLNRAVDELYLLCELECDVEQMKEAILVLEEATSDFKDLTTRVEEFENMKRSSSQFSNGALINLKSDHRRPHALSWEVRRMTTSAQKAEILSSSLEAFKKIQRERATLRQASDAQILLNFQSVDSLKKLSTIGDGIPNAEDLTGEPSTVQQNTKSFSSSKSNSTLNGRVSPQVLSSSIITSKLPPKDSSAAGKTKREQHGTESEKLLPRKAKMLAEGVSEKNPKLTDHCKRQTPMSEQDKEKEKRNSAPWQSMDAWKEKRNWEDILSSPFRVSSRVSHSPGMSRKSVERTRMLHDKLMTPEKKKKTAMDLKREAQEKHARALRIRSELENERVQKLQRTSEKLNRVTEWQAVRNMKLREGMYARQQRSESRHEAFLAQVVKRAGDESSKVNEVRFITSLNEENKKLSLRQKLHDSELRRAEKLQVMKSKQKEDMAREEAVFERRKLIEAEKLQRLAETQRRKEEAQVRREEERKASSAAREARALEQLRRKEERAKAQQEEAELLAQKLAEKLSESEQRRKFYLEQIRERASMDFRDQSSPLLRRSLNKEGQGRSTPVNTGEENQSSSVSGLVGAALVTNNVTLQHSMKRRIKRIRQRLMALKYEFPEPPFGAENASIGYRTTIGTARVKIGRWLQELQRLRQARKEGAASIGLIIAEIIKFVEGKDAELQASRQAGLLDFIASALPASHTSKPEAWQVPIHLLKLLKVVLSVSANRSYFLAQNLLPPIIPMLSAALENYIKIAASLNLPGNTSLPSSKTSVEHFESISEVLEGFLWTVTTIIGHINCEEQQLQMRDGLLELLTAYQVIHRLRDLFALYDRPQVEGSPFPSSILFSIYLLVVLTSRPETNSLIDWESLHTETLVHNKSQEAKFAEFVDTGLLIFNSGDLRTPLSTLNGSKAVHLPDVPEDTTLDESYRINKNAVSESIRLNTEKEQRTDPSFEANKSNTSNPDSPDEFEKNRMQDNMKSFPPKKDEKNLVDVGVEHKNENVLNLEQPVAFLLSAISETGLVSLLSVLTAVLLQANNRLSSEQASYILPSNFEEVATGVLKVLNNLALLDLKFLQTMLARPDLKMEFFHLLSFLLFHCTSKWKAASDQVGMLLLESLSLLGHFALFHPGNQAVLRWGKSPTILHKICDLPFVFFSDPELMPILASTLVAACYGCDQNKGVVQQEISTDMLLPLLESCRKILALRSNSNTDHCPVNESSDNQLSVELKKVQVDVPLRPSRHNSRNTRASSGKSGASGNSMKNGKLRNNRDYKATKSWEEMALKPNMPASEAPSMMLHCRLPQSFIDKAEHFFSSGPPGLADEV
ncbi:S phase cyclin A-associated protein in the endoplasmic reticulum, N-terminal [Parasponia andersonii]|uniref:S phase cyclin A-associated protein in the endoplasmic reticulum, N-terminal n=1 Tax=Parasponia andersonii TaxID=3476 RepID=A0A2P5D6Q2_PARAD|nr:S phase cyclin A-associated protein in the endoplasmic reticulum, N-terminal [Parasponia andersonii]